MFELPKSRFFIMALMLWAFTSLTALAQGVVQEIRGDVKVTAAAPGSIPVVANKGMNITSGQTITTGPKSLAIIKFVDGMEVALDQNTTFRVQEYNYDQKQPTAMRALLNLSSGIMRVVTGLINQRNPESVRIATPVATAGIRGSITLVAHFPVAGSSFGAIQGTVTVSSATGTVTVTVGNAVTTITGLSAGQLTTLANAIASGTFGTTLTTLTAAAGAAGATSAATGGIGGATAAAAAAAAAAVAASVGGQDNASFTTGTTGTTGTR